MFTVQGQGRNAPSRLRPVSVREIALRTEIGTPVACAACCAAASQMTERSDCDVRAGSPAKVNKRTKTAKETCLAHLPWRDSSRAISGILVYPLQFLLH